MMAVVVGSKGMLFSPDDYGARYFLLPEDEFEGFEAPAQTLPRIVTALWTLAATRGVDAAAGPASFHAVALRRAAA